MFIARANPAQRFMNLAPDAPEGVFAPLEMLNLFNKIILRKYIMLAVNTPPSIDLARQQAGTQIKNTQTILNELNQWTDTKSAGLLKELLELENDQAGQEIVGRIESRLSD